MITAIRFRNFRALRDTTLPLGRFTLIVGPNGSGKSTAMEAFKFVLSPNQYEFARIVTAGMEEGSTIEISMDWEPKEIDEDVQSDSEGRAEIKALWQHVGNTYQVFGPEARKPDGVIYRDFSRSIHPRLAGFRLFSFDAQAIASAVQTHPNPELASDGSNLAAVLDALTDSEPERFEALNQEL